MKYLMQCLQIKSCNVEDIADAFGIIIITKSNLPKAGFKHRFPETQDCNLWDYEEYGLKTKEAANRGQGFFTICDFVEKHGFWLDLQSRRTMKYMHELQNLFSGITGKPLPVQL